MERHDLDNLCLWKKRQFVQLSEVSDWTKQLAQALERRDQVSTQMILSMRHEPLHQAQEQEENIHRYLLTLPEETAIRLQELLDGAAAASPEEEPLCSQIVRNRNLIRDIIRLDRNLSLRLGGTRSFYQMLREN